MQDILRKSLIPLAVAMTLALALAGKSRAQDGHEHKHGAPLHGGKVSMTEEYHFEVVFAKDGLKVFPRSHEDKPIDASHLTGTATFYHPNSPKPWFERKLTATAATSGHAPSSIELVMDLSKVPATGAKVAFKVEGLPEAAEKTVNFTVPFALAPSNAIVFAKVTKADEKAIATQKLCPVSKEDLLSMGGPLKVSRGDQSIFICCKGCQKKIEANPDQYFAAQAKGTGPKHEHSDHKETERTKQQSSKTDSGRSAARHWARLRLNVPCDLEPSTGTLRRDRTWVGGRRTCRSRITNSNRHPGHEAA